MPPLTLKRNLYKYIEIHMTASLRKSHIDLDVHELKKSSFYL